jgi:hypothetical protein
LYLCNTVLPAGMACEPKLGAAVRSATTQVTTPTELNPVQTTVAAYTYGILSNALLS